MEQISPDIIERSVVKCVQSVGEYYCDQKILDTNVIVLLYILKRPLCINNLNFDCVNFENVNVRFTEKIPGDQEGLFKLAIQLRKFLFITL
jgi:hypothetical protein